MAMNRRTPFRFIALTTLVMGVFASSAPAEITACTAIASVPYTITVSGIYCLTADISTSMAAGRAIEIQTNSVVLDLNGHSLDNLSAGSSTLAYGVYASKRQNITLRNGTIRGFEAGVYLADQTPYTTSQGHVIEDLLINQSTYAGILAWGRGILVRGNQVVATGTVTSPGSDIWAIGVIGPGNRVIGNDVITVTAVGAGVSTGIMFDHAKDGLALNNRISAAAHGIEFIASTGKYRDNLTSGVAVPFTGGTSIGNNN
jgi:hypothetical protein